MNRTVHSAAATRDPARGPGQVLQRKCACGNHAPGGSRCEECRRQELRRRGDRPAASASVPPVVHEVLRSPGHPLDPAMRGFMESRFARDFSGIKAGPGISRRSLSGLMIAPQDDASERQAERVAETVVSSSATTGAERGYDFSGVRVHTDAKAAASARAVGALAYTVGRHVVLGAETSSLASSAGRHLLAHELTHVVQQGAAPQAPPRLQRQPGPAAPEDELHQAMAGPGTDEDTVFRVLRTAAATPGGIRSLQAAYDRKYGDMIQDLRGDLTDSEYARARQYLRPEIADADVQDCDSSNNPLQQPNTVRDAHARGIAMLTHAVTQSANTADPNVQALAARYFKITLPAVSPAQRDLWNHVQRALSTMMRADTEATYECEPTQNVFNGGCLANNIAISLPNIHLCPLWWTAFPTTDKRAYVLVHEWGHKFGSGVNRIFETYCFDPAFATLPAQELVHLPDTYAGYVYEIATGAQMPC